MAALNSDRDLTLADVQTTTAIKALAVEPPQPTKPPLVYVARETITVVMPIDMMGGVSG